MGGTIFSIVEDNVVRVAKNADELLNLVPRIRDAAKIDFKEVVNVDSTNVGIAEWIKLLETIRDNYDKYDAFVIAHGTNTMAYTATATSLALGPKLNKPIIFTGSQLPLTVYGDDAKFNLEHSIQNAISAVDNKIAEVMICFHDLVLRGSRTVKISESDFRAFGSPAIEPIARINANGIFFLSHAKKAGKGKFALPKSFSFNGRVLCIDLVPGLDPNYLSKTIDNQTRGIVIKSHGAGSVPDAGKMSFIPLIKKLTSNGIPVVVTSKFLGGNSFKQTNDEPAIRALKAGAISSHDMTDVAAQVKLMFMLGQDMSLQNIRKYFSKEYVGEVTE